MTDAAESEKLISHVNEGHSVEMDRLLVVTDLKRDVIDANEPRLSRAHRLFSFLLLSVSPSFSISGGVAGVPSAPVAPSVSSFAGTTAG